MSLETPQLNKLLVWLAYSELKRNPLATLVDIGTLTSAVATLLVLYGLRFGVVDQMAIGLLDDPEHKRITLIPSNVISETQIQDLEGDELVGWVVPSQGSISQQYRFKLKGSNFQPSKSFPVSPSKTSDPLCPMEFKAPYQVR